MSPEQIVEINKKFKGMVVRITALDCNNWRYTVEGPVYSADWWEDPYIVNNNSPMNGSPSGGWFIELKGKPGEVKHSRAGTPGLIVSDSYAYFKACQDRMINLEVLNVGHSCVTD
jgi:hypothetical protein